jgi:hypothetical protein
MFVGFVYFDQAPKDKDFKGPTNVGSPSVDPRFAGSILAEVDGFLRVIKIRSTTSSGGEVK